MEQQHVLLSQTKLLSQAWVNKLLARSFTSSLLTTRLTCRSLAQHKHRCETPLNTVQRCDFRIRHDLLRRLAFIFIFK